jgi:hypothetical protein
MNVIKKLFFLWLLALASTSPWAVTNADVFAYAAANYPSLFSGAPTSGQHQQYAYQYFPSSGNYLAVDTSGEIWMLGPSTQWAMTPVGSVSSFTNSIVAWEAALTPKLGVISYWGATALYDQLPAGTTAVVNPSSGIFTGQTFTVVPDASSYAAIVSAELAKNVSMLGYVPTGYFSHTCNIEGQCQTWDRITSQVQAYFQYMPGLSGIFFDEASPAVWSCGAFLAEYKQLRDIVHLYNPQAKIAFNAAVPDNCVVDGAVAGEIVVLFESDQATYFSQAANISASTTAALAKGVIPWHLVYSVSTATDLNAVITQAKSTHVSFLYATDIGGNWQAGQNTWGSLPVYWQQELALMGY